MGFKLIIINCEILENSLEITEELTTKMKNNIIPEINIIGVLEKNMDLEKILCLEAGMKDILIKPISKDGVDRMVKNWITQ